MSVEGWRYCPDLEIARSGLLILVDVSRQSVKVETILEGYSYSSCNFPKVAAFIRTPIVTPLSFFES